MTKWWKLCSSSSLDPAFLFCKSSSRRERRSSTTLSTAAKSFARLAFFSRCRALEVG